MVECRRCCGSMFVGNHYLAVGKMGNYRTNAFFFISSSFFSKIPNPKNIANDAKSGKPRDYIQVLCNGGIACACIILWMLSGQNSFFAAYFVSIAISTADTWSSELGVRYGKKAVNIVDFKPVTSGLSGGVSIFGTMVGLGGSFAIALIGYWLAHFTWQQTFLITLFGFLGMLGDSLIGALWQAAYLLPNGSFSETASQKNQMPCKGYKIITNDVVNILANLLLTILAVCVFS